MNDVATIDTNSLAIKSHALALVQAVLAKSTVNEFVIDLPLFLSTKRTAGVTLPLEYLDYGIFRDQLTDPDMETLVIVPTLDEWSTIRDTFNYETSRKFLIYNEDGHLIDAYEKNSKAHRKYCKLLKISTELDEVVKVNNIQYVANGEIKNMPRGFSFELMAIQSNFVIKDLMAKYMGKVQMHREIANCIEKDLPAIPLFYPDSPRSKLDLVVIYGAANFFDKVRRKKFYTWLATQATKDTKVVLIN